MDSSSIGSIAVNRVKDSIIYTEFLSPYIPDKDTEPVWDGNIYIYNSKNKNNKNLAGRIPVQVKGKEVQDLSKDEISYEADVNDLKNYLVDGGAIYFVVYITDDSSKFKIYYCELAPVKLQILLKNIGDQKNKNIKLKPFPEDNNEKVNIFLTSLQNFKMQKSFSNVDLPTYEELDKTSFEGFTIPLMSIDKTANPQELLIKTPTYMYAKIKGHVIPQPMPIVMENIMTSEKVEQTVSVNGHKYYDYFERIRDKNGIKVRYGNSVVLTMKGDCIAVNYYNCNYLRKRIIDLEFFLDVLKYKKIELNNKELPFVLNNDESKFNYEESKRILNCLKDIERALDILNYHGDIDITKLTKKDWRNISYIVTAFVDNKAVSNLKEDIQPVVTLDIENLKFILTFTHCENDKNTYKIKDFGNSIFPIAYFNDKTNEYIQTSQYSLLKCNDFVKCNNIRFDRILPSFTELDVDEEIISQANALILELIRAYDVTNNKEILNAAKDLSKWLLINDSFDLFLSRDIRMLNYLQIIKRSRELNDDEILDLNDIINKSNDDACIAGAYIILGNFSKANKHIDSLDEKIREDFKNYPIYSLMDNNSTLKN